MRDAWFAILLALVAGACIPVGHPGIPDKAEVTPERPTPEPTPEPSACEIDLMRERSNNDWLRARLYGVDFWFINETD